MKKWMVNHRGYLKAAHKLVSAIEPYVNYVMLCSNEDNENYNPITLSVDKNVKGLSINVSEANGDEQRIDIKGQDEAHLFYAVCDFKNKFIPFLKSTTEAFRRAKYPMLFENTLPKYSYSTAPKISQRGIWTWGHTIYDYRSFIDNMAELKMNTIIIWNDYVPTNIDEVINYAHENYIKLYLGYAWGWDTVMPSELDDNYINGIIENSLRIHREQYRDIKCDGIYFQTITEHSNETLSGRSVAKVVVDMVNRIGGEILKEQPELKLLFGLHANSVINKLDEIKEVDERISIIWENVGSYPWDYYYNDEYNFEKTLKLTRDIRDLRENSGFGGVLKSYINLDWTKFKHHEGPSPIGVSSREYIAHLESERREYERYYQASWLKLAPLAPRIIKEFKYDSMITVLVEDACFEEKVNMPTALYAELLWDYDRDINDIIYEVALNPFVNLI